MANSYEYLAVPSFSGEYGQYVSPELLYSYAKFTQKGVTLKGGGGELPLGTVLQKDANGKAVKYGSGTGKAIGFLRRGADTGAAGAPDQLGNCVISGIVKLELVVAANPAGTITAALGDLNARQDDAYSFISF
jgi:hypothetical protein